MLAQIFADTQAKSLSSECRFFNWLVLVHSYDIESVWSMVIAPFCPCILSRLAVVGCVYSVASIGVITASCGFALESR